MFQIHKIVKNHKNHKMPTALRTYRNVKAKKLRDNSCKLPYDLKIYSVEGRLATNLLSDAGHDDWEMSNDPPNDWPQNISNHKSYKTPYLNQNQMQTTETHNLCI